MVVFRACNEFEDWRYACKRANVTLDRVAARIRLVSVRFEDLNGPRGGVKKRCVVEALGEFGSLGV
jgi:hypothetical protein